MMHIMQTACKIFIIELKVKKKNMHRKLISIPPLLHNDQFHTSITNASITSLIICFAETLQTK